MKFDELDARMRVYETGYDHCVMPGMFMVARLDGRGFTRLTKELHEFETPFDERFRDHMLATTEHLMDCGFRIPYGYTQSDEISLLFHRDEETFGRKVRKYCSVLAGEASAVFSLRLGAHACFDCRVSELPNASLVRDYFRWRCQDAFRNALSAHCYWTLRKEGMDMHEATAALRGLSVADKNELLFRRGINFNELPAWQKRGVGFYFEEIELEAVNQITGEPVRALRRRLYRDLELPIKDDYDRLVMSLATPDVG